MAARFIWFTLIFLPYFFSSLGLGFENPIWGASQIDSLNFDQYKHEQRLLGNNQQGSLLESLYEFASRGHTTLGYFKARQLLHGRVYLEQNKGQYAVRDVYCLKYFTNSDFGRKEGLGPDQIPNSDILNTEHTWPQSRFTPNFPDEMQKSDLHHLFPSDTEMNSKRANFKFAELSGKTIPIKCATSKLANTPIGFRFEPPPVHRGNVARALFYFSARYKIPIDNDEEVYLRKWNQEDPVDQEEKAHHELIYQFQGNRNPFVDRPDVVNQVADF
jgi:hypothetical protein